MFDCKTISRICVVYEELEEEEPFHLDRHWWIATVAAVAAGKYW